MSSRPFRLLAVSTLLTVLLQSAAADAPLALGSRWELLVDRFLVERQDGASLKLHTPVKREVVLVTDQPWEGPTSAYFSVLQDGKTIRLYYRGSYDGPDNSVEQVTCVAESNDGIHFKRPELGLVSVGGSSKNNVIWQGVESHNFAAFLDTNPACKPGERYKALGGIKQAVKKGQEGTTPNGLYAFASADGVRWRKMQETPVMTKGAFDSQNLAFWDEARGRYACYSRIFSNKVRAIQSTTSADFLQWSAGVPNRYAEGVPAEHFYTSATLPCPGAPHLLFAFPKRFVPNRKKVAEHKQMGVSDAIFMSSRDGVLWDRSFLEGWVRPGLDQKNWTERNSMTAWGIVETAPDEWSMYISEHYRSPGNRLRRITLRPYGFASMHAGAQRGELTTKPFRFEGQKLQLNYATSAAGSVQIEIQDESGAPIPGFALTEMAELYGDELAAVAKWKSGSDLASLRGKTIRLRVALQDADLFAFRFAE